MQRVKKVNTYNENTIPTAFTVASAPGRMFVLVGEGQVKKKTITGWHYDFGTAEKNRRFRCNNSNKTNLCEINTGRKKIIGGLNIDPFVKHALSPKTIYVPLVY